MTWYYSGLPEHLRQQQRAWSEHGAADVLRGIRLAPRSLVSATRHTPDPYSTDRCARAAPHRILAQCIIRPLPGLGAIAAELQAEGFKVMIHRKRYVEKRETCVGVVPRFTLPLIGLWLSCKYLGQ